MAPFQSGYINKKYQLFACVFQGNSPVPALLVYIIHISFLYSVLIGFYFCFFLGGQMDILVLVRLAFLFSVVKSNTPISSGIPCGGAISGLNAHGNAGKCDSCSCESHGYFFIYICSFHAVNKLAVYGIKLLGVIIINRNIYYSFINFS